MHDVEELVRSDGSADVTEHESIPHAVATWAEKNGGAPAVRCGDRRLSYSDFDSLVARIRTGLLRAGARPGDVVGIYCERSPELVATAVAILSAGCSYVPIRLGEPAERLRYILADASVRLIATTSAQLDVQAELGLDVATVVVDELHEEDATSAPPGLETSGRAYVIYTSGSTGKPKGVAVSQRSLMAYLEWAVEALPRAEKRAATLLHTPLSFDFSITSIYTPLIRGEELAILPEGVGVRGLATELSEPDGFAFVRFTPSHLRILLDEMRGRRIADGTFLVGGEEFPAGLLRQWREVAPGVNFVNHYGPTEAVVGCCAYVVRDEAPIDTSTVPIGRPMPGRLIYLLDDAGEPVPAGEIGEICVGGNGLADGYVNDAALTEERFVPDTLAAEPGARRYRTGDLGRLLASGDIEFIGRRDDQVKIRGHRIELGEVAAALRTHPAVQDAVVVARDEGDGLLYLVAFTTGDADAAVLREHLVAKTPDFMVPSRFVRLPALPLSAHGKIDHQALAGMPVTAWSDAVDGVDRSLPASVEEALLAIWRDLLGVVEIRLQDNFFDLGGDSLLALRVATAAEGLGFSVDAVDVLEHQTVGELAAVVREKVPR